MSLLSNYTNNQENINKPQIFYLTLEEIFQLNKLLSYGYKIIDESDKDIQIFIKNKRMQENKTKKKK